MVAQIELKLSNYNSQKLDIEEAVRNNDALGQGITSLVETRATPREISKFRFHVEDTEKITNLLVSLSGRLARTEHALSNPDHPIPQSEKVPTTYRNQARSEVLKSGGARLYKSQVW